jgi:NTE family protein
MEITEFTENPKLQNLLYDLRNDENLKGKRYSDVEDAAGNQYVDFVMEGGGVWGIALAGYVHVLEEMGIRFLQLGGASAGAINTLFMASAGPIDEVKTPWILRKISEKNLSDLIDGDSDAVDFIETVMEKSNVLKLMRKGVQVVDNLKNEMGLNPGDNFTEWVKECLAEKKISDTADLKELRSKLPVGLVNVADGQSVPYPKESVETICIISAEITTETKVEFPKMAHLYWAEPDSVHPAEFVRASMSIPIFFHPYTVKNVPNGEGTWEKWKECTGYIGGAPSEVKFVDGGMVSNFPIDIFHNFRNPRPAAPTFGVKLEIDRNKPNNTDNIFGLLGAMLNTARHIHDYQFILKHPDFEQLVAYIDTGDHNWLNFNLSDEDQVDLFNRGAKAAAGFLRKFNWERYKDTREKLFNNKPS